jgi:gluconokinase
LAKAIVLMGVSGCGKTSVGKSLSAAVCLPFFDGDDFHSQANVEKMAQGIPLDDDDRRPWLDVLHNLIADHLKRGESLIMACSALKQQYRDLLGKGGLDVRFVHLKGSFDLIYGRMQQRAGHYMKKEMLQSQFDELEEPDGALEIDISLSVPEIVERIVQALDLAREQGSRES